jgi:nucleotide-binding universal stress UspA family protein
MANLPKEKIKVKDVIYPLNAQQVFIGLELDESDQRLMEYFNYIDKFVKAEKITCVHVVPEVTSVFPFQGLFAEGAKTTERKMNEALVEKMKSGVAESSAKDLQGKVRYLVQSGSPLEALTQVANGARADLVVIGKQAGKDYHMIKAANIVRLTEANVMVVPEKSRKQLRTVIVPVDFSEHSARALKNALGFKHAAVDPIRIVAVHAYQKLTPYIRGLGMISEAAEQNLIEQQFKNMHEFIADTIPDFKEDIELQTIVNEQPAVAPAILKKARQLGADLIIMGAKGHSKLTSLLLGSTSEQLLRENEDTPVLIVH